MFSLLNRLRDFDRDNIDGIESHEAIAVVKHDSNPWLNGELRRSIDG